MRQFPGKPTPNEKRVRETKMASKSSSCVVLIRQLLVNRNRNNPWLDGLVHHPRKLLSNSIETLTSISTPQTIVPSICKPFSYSLSPQSFHLLQHRHLSSSSDSDKLCISRPPDIVMVRSKTAFARAVKQVKGGRLPAIFYYNKNAHACPLKASIICKVREKFPHVTIYKIVIPYMDKGMQTFCERMNAFNLPAFHFYKNGIYQLEYEMNHGSAEGLLETCEKLYRYVIPVESIPPKNSSHMVRMGAQLVLQAKKDEYHKGIVGELNAKEHEHHKGIVGELKAKEHENGKGTRMCHQMIVGCGAAAPPQWSGFPPGGSPAECVNSKRNSDDVPSIDAVLKLVEDLPCGQPDSKLWYFARGLFAGQPEKRVIYTKFYFAKGPIVRGLFAGNPRKRGLPWFYKPLFQLKWLTLHMFDE